MLVIVCGAAENAKRIVTRYIGSLVDIFHTPTIKILALDDVVKRVRNESNPKNEGQRKEMLVISYGAPMELIAAAIESPAKIIFTNTDLQTEAPNARFFTQLPTPDLMRRILVEMTVSAGSATGTTGLADSNDDARAAGARDAGAGTSAGAGAGTGDR